MSRAVAGWLLLLAAFALFAVGLATRSFIGRRRDWAPVRRFVSGFRDTRVARVLFGPVEHDALDDDELDQMILMPTIVVACGLCLTAVFLLGYGTLT
ncbi:hypothetical protein [Mycobacterium sp. QGD 101]|uniref:hypothetical protein n=1 Tax=Mycobacterium hubeiense TaxID=1867256 RepID=UPI000C7F267B